MSLFLSPIGNSQQLDANGDPLVGGQIFTYLAGSTTPAATYTDSTGATAQANPIVLNSLGVPASPIWLTGGVSYKLVIKDAANVTLRTVDGVSGINDSSASTAEWVDSGFVPSFISATSFSVPGDHTDTLLVGRRLKTRNTSGLAYSTIATSAFAAALTTITVVNDSTVLDSGLSSVAYGLLSPTNPSLPSSVAARSSLGVGDIKTTAGTSTAYTLTPAPAITAYTAGQIFFVNFHAACGAAPTLAISGLASPPNLVKENPDGTFSNLASGDVPINHRSRVTLLSATQAWVETLPDVSLGRGQTVQDMTASRALSTTFTNSTGRPIFVTVRIGTSSATATHVSLTVAGVILLGADVAASGFGVQLSAIVPAGATYSAVAGGGAGTLNQWIEVR